MRERVLVTGASGFVGASLTRALVQDEQEVHLLLRPQTDPWRLAGLEGAYTVHTADLLDAAAVRSAVAAARPDVVYHLAAHVGRPEPCQRGDVLAGNLLATSHLLDAAHTEGCRTLVYTGTGLEYGPQQGPVDESTPVNPQTDYAVAKAATTLLCLSDSRQGRPVVVVRIFGAYGPREAPYRLVPYVMECCLRRVSPRLSAGRQRRDFIYVDDVVALLRRAAELPPTPGLVLHAGSGREYTVRDMVETIRTVCRGRLPFYDAETEDPEPAPYLASVDRTCAVTGWAPCNDLRAGVERTWEWYRDHHRKG
jgi:nucleoside-diphosphate-sugar epimerase